MTDIFRANLDRVLRELDAEIEAYAARRVDAARSEGWDNAVRALRDQRSARYNEEFPDVRATWAADWLAANKPKEPKA